MEPMRVTILIYHFHEIYVESDFGECCVNTSSKFACNFLPRSH